MRVTIVPCLKDNYAYVLSDASGAAVVIDPSEAGPVANVLTQQGLRLTAIWLTHHHWDHVGGIEALCDAHPGVEVVGSRYDADLGRIARLSRAVGDGDRWQFAEHTVQVSEVPGHTLGAIAYQVGGCLFTGDTLFLGGCGRLFEGTPAQMQASLATLRSLDPTLLVYPGHEYTVSNLRFGLTIEPNNAALGQRLQEAQHCSERGESTVPASLAVELQTNVFLRWDAPTVIAYAQAGEEPAEVFAAVRRAKDRY